MPPALEGHWVCVCVCVCVSTLSTYHYRIETTQKKVLVIHVQTVRVRENVEGAVPSRQN